MTQKEIILNYLESIDDWVFEYKIRAVNTPFGWIGARGDRDVRDLIKKDLVEYAFDGKYRIVRNKRERTPKVELPRETVKMF